MKDDIESRVLELLNKILARESLKICVVDGRGVCICGDSTINPCWSWDSLDSMLFASDEHTHYSLPEYYDMIDDDDLRKRKLKQLGLIDVIKESMSFEELALKLELMV